AAVEQRRHLQHVADRQHAGAADAHDADPHVVRGPPLGLRQLDVRQSDGGLVTRLWVDDGHERWTVAVDAGAVLVARGLVDTGLAPELRLDRFDGKTPRLGAAVAAALAHALVDDDTAHGDRCPPALACAP